VTFPISKPLSVLLTSASSGGTIAAVRNLAANGIEVGIVSSERLCAAAWSRCVSRTYLAPPETESRAFLDRLLVIGAADNGQILLPTSDKTAWLYTVNAAQLEHRFHVYQPSITSMRRILDKELFADAATRAGLDVVPGWYPRNIDDLAALAPNLPYPILIKPRTHIHRLGKHKGVIVRSSSELLQQYRQFIIREKAEASYDPLMPDADLPILQQFVSATSEGVHSITGFIDRTGDLFVTRHSTKVFQRSPPLGIGICFESRSAAPLLSDAIRRLCREIGYFGIFEVEFIWFDGRWTAIDFNPRLFHQVGMDIARGMPLPLLACLDAAGETAALRDAVAKAKAVDEDEKVFLCDRFLLRVMLFALTVTSRLSPTDRTYWIGWRTRNAGCTIDIAADKKDPIPGIIHVLSEIYEGLKVLPRFLRSKPPQVDTPICNKEKS
jgi:D-aspartate ligase